MDKSAEERILEDLIRHMYTHRHLSNLGYDNMSMQMQNTFNCLVCRPVSDRNVQLLGRILDRYGCGLCWVTAIFFIYRHNKRQNQKKIKFSSLTAMTAPSSVKFTPVVIIGKIIGAYVTLDLSQPEPPCLFHIIGLKISLAAQGMTPFCGGLTSVQKIINRTKFHPHKSYCNSFSQEQLV